MTPTPVTPKRTKWHRSCESAARHNETAPVRKSFLIHYHKQSTKRLTKRKIDPLRVNGNLLIAYDHKRKAIRSFKLERMKHMEKSAFWEGFEKRAGGAGGGLSTAINIAALGALAAPSVAAMGGKPMKEKTYHKLELAGLGALIGTEIAPKLAPLIKKLKLFKVR